MRIFKMIGTINILLWVFVVPSVSAQNGLTVSVFEYPEPIVFSKERHFKNGRASTMTLLVEPAFGGGDDDDDDFDDDFDDDDDGGSYGSWDIMISADGNLNSSNHQMPVSKIWARAQPNMYFRSTGRIFLNTQLQTIAQSKPRFSNSNSSFLQIKLKAKRGDHLFTPAGEYSTDIYFTIMMD